MRKITCLESTLDMLINGYTIRLWIDETEHQDYEIDRAEYYGSFVDFLKETRTNEEIVEFADTQLKKINAIQIYSPSTNEEIRYGIVAYLVDFNDNVHG